MKIKLTPDTKYPWMYRTQEDKLVSFKKCTLGKYRDKLYMIIYNEDNKIEEDYLVEVLEEIKYSVLNKVIVPEEIIVDKDKFTSREIFFNMARCGIFTVDDENSYCGYTFNEKWNGWECPYFAEAEAKHIVQNVQLNTDDPFEYNYDEEDDCYYFINHETKNKEIIGMPLEINTNMGKTKVYNFGNSGWPWTEIKDYSKN